MGVKERKVMNEATPALHVVTSGLSGRRGARQTVQTPGPGRLRLRTAPLGPPVAHRLRCVL